MSVTVTSLQNNHISLEAEFRQFQKESTEISQTILAQLEELRSEYSRQKTNVDYLTYSAAATNAKESNSKLRSDLMRLNTVPVFENSKGAVQIRWPDASLLPRTPKAFYALRNPDSDKKKDSLVYMLLFYGIQHGDDEINSAGSDEMLDSSIVHTAKFFEDPQAVLRKGRFRAWIKDSSQIYECVSLLEGELGLQEDHIKRFQSSFKAWRERDKAQPPTTLKRPRTPDEEPGRRFPQWDFPKTVDVQKLIYPSSGNDVTSPESQDRIGWRAPSFTSGNTRNLAAVDDGSPTNSNTSPESRSSKEARSTLPTRHK